MRLHNSKPKQEIKLEDIFNDEKKQGVKDLIDAHKQETLEENCCTPVGQIKRYVDCKGCDRKPKQEKLKEVANKLLWKKYPYHPPKDAGYWQDMFIEGAKWQAERMYSEEQLFKILLDFVEFPHDHNEGRGSIINRFLKELKKK
jgi:hypothetical protein